MSRIPQNWLTTTALPLDSWDLKFSLHRPPTLSQDIISRASAWLERNGEPLTPINIYQNAEKLAWRIANDLNRSKPSQAKALEFLGAVTRVENLNFYQDKNGNTKELGKFDAPLACFVTWRNEDEWRAMYPTHTEVGMNTPKQWSNWSRHLTRVKRVQAMAFDFDGINDAEKDSILEGFKELTYIAYASFSHKAPHKDESCSFRVIIPLSREVTPHQYNHEGRGLWHKLKSIFPENDKQTNDPTRLWYLPSFRADREEHFFALSNEGKALDVDAILAEEGSAQTARPNQSDVNVDANSFTSQERPRRGRGRPRGSRNRNAQTATNDPVDPNSATAQRVAGQQTNYRRVQVKDDHPIRCHDGQERTFQWVIDNWETLPKNAGGNYQCCRPHSQTVGSAFVHIHHDEKCSLTRYRMTSVPSTTHWDCLMTNRGITLNYDGRCPRGRLFRPHQNRQNVAKMIRILVEENHFNIFSCARNLIGYVGATRLSNGETYEIESELVRRWFFGGINPVIVASGIQGYLHEYKQDALKEYLENLERVPNVDLDTVFIRYLNVEDTPLHRVMTRKWFIGAVARVFDWGCKNDTVLIFSGNQGVGKTTFWKTIAGRCTYTGRPYHKEGKVDINNKDSLFNFLQAWIYEWGELSGMNYKSKEDFKLLTSQQENTLRRAYARWEEDILRKGVIVGSCNPDQTPLVDEENRRIWLMTCRTDRGDFSYSIEDLKKEIAGIWAEAVHLYKHGILGEDEWEQPIYEHALWWLMDEDRLEHIRVNEKMKEGDVHYDMFYAFIMHNPNLIISTDDLIEEIYNEKLDDGKGGIRKRAKVIKPPHKKEVSRILKHIGAKYKNVRIKSEDKRINGKVRKMWVLPELEIDPTLHVEEEIEISETDGSPYANMHMPSASDFQPKNKTGASDLGTDFGVDL